MDNKFDFNIKKSEPQAAVPAKVVSREQTAQEQINGLKSGGKLTIAMDGNTYNELYDQFKPQRKSGVLSFEFNPETNVATVRNLKPNDTEL